MKDSVSKDNLDHRRSENSSEVKGKESIIAPRSSNTLASITEANRLAKEAIAKDLEALGLSKDAIARLLGID